jgi:hypothetical protein
LELKATGSKVRHDSADVNKREDLTMSSPIANVTSTQATAVSDATQQSTPQPQPTPPAGKPQPTPTDTVTISSAAQTAIQQAQQTGTQTAQGTAKGGHQANQSNPAAPQTTSDNTQKS